MLAFKKTAQTLLNNPLMKSSTNLALKCALTEQVLIVLRFYGPVNPMGSCRAQSVYLTTILLGRLNPLSG